MSLARQGRGRNNGTALDNLGVTVRGHERVVTDGPYAESKDLVTGNLIVEAASLEDAIDVARTCPTYEFGGSVEVRPVQDLSDLTLVDETLAAVSSTELVEDLFRKEYAHLVSALTRVLGPSNVPLAEDVVHDALVSAMHAWRFGLPQDPKAWIIRAAHNRAIDIIRREQRRRSFLPELATTTALTSRPSFWPLAGSGACRRRGRRRCGTDRADAVSEFGLDPGQHGIVVPRCTSRTELKPAWTERAICRAPPTRPEDRVNGQIGRAATSGLLASVSGMVAGLGVCGLVTGFGYPWQSGVRSKGVRADTQPRASDGALT